MRDGRLGVESQMGTSRPAAGRRSSIALRGARPQDYREELATAVGAKGARWSPDGAKLVFVSNRNGSNEIYTMNADGSGMARLPFAQASEFGPAWSPDGTKIAFVSNGNEWDIFTMNSNGTNPVRITAGLNNYDPVWSPDGTKIAFWRGTGQSHAIYVVNPDGTGLIQLTNNASDDVHPAWSPDAPRSHLSGPSDSTLSPSIAKI